MSLSLWTLQQRCFRSEDTSEAARGALKSAVGGGYCLLQMPLKLALAVRGIVGGHRLGALEGGTSPPSNAPALQVHKGSIVRCYGSGLSAPPPFSAEQRWP